jgi:3'-phosphoadenosine 5'-phosphosulfate sulfotransferase (PAPS reductase)/FAD synthetase
MDRAARLQGSSVRYVVMYSGGVGSWAAAKRLPAGADATLLFADTRIEDEDTYRFLRQSAANTGHPLVEIQDGRTPWEVFKDKRWIGNSRIAQCSHLLKQVPARAWMDEHGAGATVVVGIDWSEAHRLEAITKHWAPFPVIAPLCDPPYLSKRDLIDWAKREGIPEQRLYGMGFAHANCGGFCVRAGVGHFANLYRQMPERYRHHEDQEQALREFLDKDQAILSRVRDDVKQPLTLRQLRHELEQEKQVDMLDLGGCGCWV